MKVNVSLEIPERGKAHKPDERSYILVGTSPSPEFLPLPSVQSLESVCA